MRDAPSHINWHIAEYGCAPLFSSLKESRQKILWGTDMLDNTSNHLMGKLTNSYFDLCCQHKIETMELFLKDNRIMFQRIPVIAILQND